MRREKVLANECIEKMIEADRVILSSPVYFNDVTAEMKALLDCAGFVSRANGGMYRNKVGAAWVSMRRDGAIHTLDIMNPLFLGGEMIIVVRGIPPSSAEPYAFKLSSLSDSHHGWPGKFCRAGGNRR